MKLVATTWIRLIAFPARAFSLVALLVARALRPAFFVLLSAYTLAFAALGVDWSAAITADSRRAWFVGLAVVLVLNAAIASAYYLRVIAAMYFKSTKRGVQADGGLAAGIAMLACLVVVGAVSIQPRGLFVSASRAGDVIEKSNR